jgi:S-adenosylmethionine synthetase
MTQIEIAGIPPCDTGGPGLEIVERKGLGHPDTICDALAEELSRALCHFYLERFGLILHHNVDKALLWAGRSRPTFGGGAVLEPMHVYLAGRATLEYRGVPVPVAELAEAATQHWLSRLHALDPARHLRLHCLVRPGSAELVELFESYRRGGRVLANDTSIGAGFAPLSELETLVLAVERRLNAPAFKTAHPETGEDIKVMGERRDGAIALTVACAFVDRHLAGLDGYRRARDAVAAEVRRGAAEHASLPVEVAVNAGDDLARGNVYLTVTGTSAEGGDDGQVGRGNRVNGLITPARPMSLEAVAGKNPVSHVGKLYNIAARDLAQAIASALPEAAEVHCYLLSRIGWAIEEPRRVDVRVRWREGGATPDSQRRIEELVHAQLARIPRLAGELLERQPDLW